LSKLNFKEFLFSSSMIVDLVYIHASVKAFFKGRIGIVWDYKAGLRRLAHPWRRDDAATSLVGTCALCFQIVK